MSWFCNDKKSFSSPSITVNCDSGTSGTVTKTVLKTVVKAVVLGTLTGGAIIS
jgi:hypothetical protein